MYCSNTKSRALSSYFRHCSRRSSSTVTGRVKTGIVALNMGGPQTADGTADFLRRLFLDADIIPLGGGRIQRAVASAVVKLRAPKVQAQYSSIGGSPIGAWTRLQMEAMCRVLDDECPESGPHKSYIAFRYAPPLTEDALVQMQADGVQHAVAFSQYPQFCCSTTGSSLKHLWREVQRLEMDKAFGWSLIDRWFLDSGYIEALAERIADSLLANASLLTAHKGEDCVLLFSAHSIPMKTVNKGDPYVFEVAATVKAVVRRLSECLKGCEELSGVSLKHQICWQSKVGCFPWMLPSTDSVLKANSHKTVFVVPFVFTTDHIETLFELDIDYKHVATAVGIQNYIRVPALNDSPAFIRALSGILKRHLAEGNSHSADYALRCHRCDDPNCRQILNPIFKQ